MKKRTLGIVIIATVSLLLSAAISLGTLMYVMNRNVKETGNVLGVSWYNESDKEFTITTKEQLIELSKLSSFYTFEKQTIKLGADIVLNEGNAKEWITAPPNEKWSPIQNFAGTFDGQGHTISGLYAKAYEAPVAMFANTDYLCIVSDIKLVNSYFETNGGKGTASFVATGGGKFTKLYSDAILTHQGEHVGGIAGKISKQAAFYECWYDGTINASQRRVGGIVAVAENPRVEIKHCLFSGTINQEMFYNEAAQTGGLVGLVFNNSGVIIDDSLSSGSITLKAGGYTGSVAGQTGPTSDNKMSNVYAVKETFESVIGVKAGTNDGGPIALPKKQMTGVEAYRWTSLDFDTYWAAIDGETPVLKHFADSAMNLEGVVKAYDTSWYNKDFTMFTIKTKEQLYGFWFLASDDNFENKTISLGADIVVNEGKASDWAKNAPDLLWNPIGASVAFAGKFDGKGHTISGLYIDSTTAKSGLFAQTALNSMVKNLKLTNSYIRTTSTHTGAVVGHAYGSVDSVYSDVIIDASGSGYFVGGIVGALDYYTLNYNYKQSVNNCWFDGTITVKGTKQAIGGIVGGAGRYSGTGAKDPTKFVVDITHCLNTGTITVDSGCKMTGGIIGCDWHAMVVNIDNCLNVGKVTGGSAIGAILGAKKNASSTINSSNAYATKSSCSVAGNGVLLPDNWLKGKAAYEYSFLDFEKYWTTVKDSTPELRTFASKVQTASGEKKVDVSWYNADAKEMVISDVKDLYGFYILSATEKFAGQTIKMDKNIVLNDGDAVTFATTAPANEWMPIGASTAFAGTFDGQGHTISGLYIDSTTAKSGLFAQTALNSMVKNLKLTNSYIRTTSTHTGAVVGHAYGSVDSVYSDVIIDASGSGFFVGGIVGALDYHTLDSSYKQSVENCWFDGTITVKDNKQAIGGIVGGTGRYGGAGAGDATNFVVGIKHCLNTGTITADADCVMVGGILGCDWHAMVLNVEDCLNVGKVSGSKKEGAIIGRVKNAKTVYNVTNSYATNDSCSLAGYGTKLPNDWLTDNKAYEYTYLDFAKYWTTVANSTPELRTFASKVQTASGEKKLDISWYDEKKDTYVLKDMADMYGFYLLSSNKNFKGKTVKLGADIVMNDGDATTFATIAPENLWMPIGASTAFAGTFDGKGHTISGLYIDSTTAKSGLFAQTALNSMVKNLKLTNSYIRTTSTHTGAVVGHVYGSVDSVYSDVIIDASGSGYFVGGIVGALDYYTLDSSYKQSVKNCWFDGTITVKDNKQAIGGIVGGTGRYSGAGAGDATNFVVNIKHCLNTGTITVDSGCAMIGGIVGCDWNAMVLNIEDCLNVGEVSGSQTVGAILGRVKNAKTVYEVTNSYATNDSCSLAGYGTKLPNDWLTDNKAYEYTYLDFSKYWTTVANSTPELRTFASKVQTASGEKKLDISWYDEKKDTYVLKDMADMYGFYLLSSDNSFKGKTVKLGADIVMNDGDATTFATTAPENVWMPIGAITTFAGTFDGQGHTISGLYIDSTTAKSGLFAQTALNSMVKNLKLTNSYIRTTSTHIGAVVGHAYGSVDSVYSDVIIDASGSGYFVGGIVGALDYYTLDSSYKQSIKNCWFDGTITVKDNKQAIGGIVGGTGRYSGAGAGDAKNFVVGIKHCLNTGMITTDSGCNRIGGIVGCDWHAMVLNIDDCLNIGKVTGGTDMGAVLGMKNNTSSIIRVSDSYATKSSCSAAGSAVLLPDNWLKGKAAYEYSYLDFEKYWTTVDNSTPELRTFAKKVQAVSGEKKMDVSWYDADAKEMVISDAKDLYGFYVLSATENFAGQTIKMDKDIILNEGNAAEWATKAPTNEWFPASNAVPFAGTFDGQNHAISGMYINTTAGFGGFISRTDYGSMIKNLKLVNGHLKTTVGWCGSVVGKAYGSMHSVYSDVYITSNAGFTGGIVGDVEYEHVNDFETYSSTYTQCWYAGVMSVKGGSSGGFAGQIYGSSNAAIKDKAKVTFTDCLVTGTFTNTGTGDRGSGGFAGRSERINLEFIRCIVGNTMTVNANDTAAGSFFGNIPTAGPTRTMTDCYATVQSLSGNKAYGAIGTGVTFTDGRTCTFKSEAELAGIDGYNLLKNTYSITTKKGEDAVWITTGGVPELMKYSNNVVDMGWYYNNPDATEFVIKTADELYSLGYISQTTNFAGKTIKLADDIVLNKGDADDWADGAISGLRKWKSIGSNAAATQFKGTFDGQGHTISGLYGEYTTTCQGMFATVGNGGSVKNLRLVNSYLTSSSGYLGSIVGRSDRGIFSKIYSDAYVVGTGVARPNGGSYDVNSGYIGGIAGVAISPKDSNDDVIFSECWYNGQLTSTTARNGGIVGNVEASAANGTDKTYIQDCLFTGSVATSVSYHVYGSGTGGIVGTSVGAQANIVFKNCIALDTVVITVNANHFLGALHGSTVADTSTNISIDNCYVIGEKVPPVGVTTHSSWKGTVSGSATVVENLSDAAAMATTSSAWTTVDGTPVLKEFKDLVPKQETNTVNLLTMLMSLFTGKEN